MKNKTTLLIMAAGMGSRFGSLKQITPLGPHKKALLHYTITMPFMPVSIKLFSSSGKVSQKNLRIL